MEARKERWDKALEALAGGLAATAQPRASGLFAGFSIKEKLLKVLRSDFLKRTKALSQRDESAYGMTPAPPRSRNFPTSALLLLDYGKCQCYKI